MGALGLVDENKQQSEVLTVLGGEWNTDFIRHCSCSDVRAKSSMHCGLRHSWLGAMIGSAV